MQDDFTLMVLKCDGDVEQREVKEIVLENRKDVILTIRRFIMEEARRLPFRPEELSHIEIAVGEAATNALIHGQSPDPKHNKISVACEVAEDYLRIRIEDDGISFTPNVESVKAPPLMADRGRGIFIMKSLMDDLSYETLPKGTALTMLKRLESKNLH